MPFHHDAADRMLKCQARRVQGLARKATQQFAQLRHTFLRAFEINAVAYQRMFEMRQMHADLVGASGFQTATQ